MAKVFLLLGSNMGNRKAYIDKTLDCIENEVGSIVHQSALYETAAWGNTEQLAFLNMAIEINTALTSNELLTLLQFIELELGRERKEKWGPRIIDIDILFYESLILRESALTIPHPLLHKRRFALAPLTEIAADFIHPVLGESVKNLLDNCTDPLPVKIYEDH